MSASDNTYTFTFPPPNASQVAITWADAQGLHDLATVPNAFKANTSGTPWQYSTVDAVPPRVARVDPPAGLRVRSLGSISVTFDEAVSGVTADDLLIDGRPAQQVIGSSAGPYTFVFSETASPGPVTITWATGQGIHDLASRPNAFSFPRSADSPMFFFRLIKY